MSISSTKTKDLATATERDPRWARMTARDSGADGSFFYSVRTTGVYCRPSCAVAAPPPRERAVPFHPSGCRAGGVPALQALQARPAVHRRAARGRG